MTKEYQLTEILNSNGDRQITRYEGVSDIETQNRVYADWLKLTTEKPDVLARIEYRECGPWYVEAATDLGMIPNRIVVEQPGAGEVATPMAEGSATCEPAA